VLKKNGRRIRFIPERTQSGFFGAHSKLRRELDQLIADDGGGSGA